MSVMRTAALELNPNLCVPKSGAIDYRENITKFEALHPTHFLILDETLNLPLEK